MSYALLVYIDLGLLVAMVLLGVYMSKKVFGFRFLWFYWIVPELLWTTDLVGSFMQLYHVEPAWVQSQLHNMGAGAFLVVLSSASVWAKHRILQVHGLVLGAPICMAVATVWFIAVEIAGITIYRAKNMANGHSGNFDWASLVAYGVGLGLMVLNYFALRKTCYKSIYTN